MRNKWSLQLLGWFMASVLTVTSIMGIAPGTTAAAPAGIRVTEAIGKGNSGETATVSGYVVGHATGSLTADFEPPFGNDFNLLIADTAGEQDKTKLIDVQVPSDLRAKFGLQSNPELIGQQIHVTGTLTAYNNFPGIKNVSVIELAGAQPDPGEPGEDPGDPGTGGTPELPDGTGKKVLFDNTHAQTAGAADWVIDGAFSDFAEGLRGAGFTVESLDRPAPFHFGEPAITYNRLQDYDVFIIPEANIPFKEAEQDALVQYVQEGGAVFFISDHYNADRNKNRWDASEVFNGFRRGAYSNPAQGMNAEEASSPAMQGLASSDWLADHFGVRFRYNAIGDVNANDIVAPSQSFGITEGVDEVAMHAGSTLAILDPYKAKGIVYVPTGVPAWGNAVDRGVYNGGGRAEGPYAAIGKLGLGKTAFIGDSSPVEDATPKYKREENGQTKKTYDGFKEADDAKFLVQTVRWLAYDENYTSFNEVPGLQLDTPTVLSADEAPAATTEPQPEPWSAPAPGYKWYDPATFKPGSYGSMVAPTTEPVYEIVHQSPLPSSEEFQIRVTADGLTPGQTISDLKVGFYLAGGEQIARFKNSDGSWTAYNYSPAFSLTANGQGHAAQEMTVQFKPGMSGSANMRLKQGSANVITNTVTIANVAAEPLPGDHPPVPGLVTVAEARQVADGTVVTLEGVIISKPGLFGGQGFYLQDNTAGIYVFQSEAGYQAGDLIRISAIKTLFNGEVELENPVVIEKKGTRPIPAPLIQDSVNDSNQGQLITLKNVTVSDVVQASPGGSFEFSAVSADGTSTRIRMDGRTGVDFGQFTATFPDGSMVDITGVSSIFRGNYQLKPLSMDHVVLSDATAPVTAAHVEGKTGEGTYNLKDVTVTLTSNDGGSGVLRTEYRVNAGEWSEANTPIILSHEGTYILEYRAVDRAGNVEETQKVIVSIDKSAPEIQVDGSLTTLQTEKNLGVDITAEDQISGLKKVTYILDGRPIDEMEKVAPYTLKAGKHTLIITAEDQVGHSTSRTVTLEVTIDIDHLDELITIGKAQGFIKNTGTVKSLKAVVSALQKAKTERQQEIILNTLQLVIKAESIHHITRDFSKLLLDDVRYLKAS